MTLMEKLHAVRQRVWKVRSVEGKRLTLGEVLKLGELGLLRVSRAAGGLRGACASFWGCCRGVGLLQSPSDDEAGLSCRQGLTR
jgi:hypothetical protein